jgi:hypothetical protein
MMSVSGSTSRTRNGLSKAIVPSLTTATLYWRPLTSPPIAVPPVASYMTTEPVVSGKSKWTVLVDASTHVMRSLGGGVEAALVSVAVIETFRPAVIVVPVPTDAVTVGSTMDSP